MGYAELVAAVNAILAAISVWQSERDFRRTKDTYEETFERTRAEPETEAVAARISGVLPPSVAQTFRDNLDRCWTKFNDCIGGKTQEDELAKCESGLAGCICGNLRVLVRTNGSLPNDLVDLWKQFSCGAVPTIS